MFIKPLQNFKVRDPILKDHLPDEGRNVTPSPYWTRRIAEGAIEVIEIEKSEPKPDPSDQEKPAVAKTSKGAVK